MNYYDKDKEDDAVVIIKKPLKIHDCLKGCDKCPCNDKTCITFKVGGEKCKATLYDYYLNKQNKGRL